MEIAEVLGVTQIQVSRLMPKLSKLKNLWNSACLSLCVCEFNRRFCAAVLPICPQMLGCLRIIGISAAKLSRMNEEGEKVVQYLRGKNGCSPLSSLSFARPLRCCSCCNPPQAGIFTDIVHLGMKKSCFALEPYMKDKNVPLHSICSVYGASMS